MESHGLTENCLVIFAFAFFMSVTYHNSLQFESSPQAGDRPPSASDVNDEITGFFANQILGNISKLLGAEKPSSDPGIFLL